MADFARANEIVKEHLRQQFERSFNAAVNDSWENIQKDKEIEQLQKKNMQLQNKVEQLQEQVDELYSNIDALNNQVCQMEQRFKMFDEQFSDKFDFDLDDLWEMSGIRCGRKYIIDVLTKNFECGEDYVIKYSKLDKYYLTHQTFNHMVLSLRSMLGFHRDILPEYVIVRSNDYYRPSDYKKNKRFPNRR